MKKQSLFAQRMGLKKETEEPSLPAFSCLEIKERPAEEIKDLERSLLNTPVSSMPETIKLDNLEPEAIQEYPGDIDTEIHQENMSRIQKMSQEEYEEAYNEIMGTMSPGSIEMLKNRGRVKSKNVEIDTTPSFGTCNQSLNEPSERSEEIKYDIHGNSVQEYVNGEWTNPEMQGRNLPELLSMCRSIIPAQRYAAFSMLQNVLSKDWDNSFSYLESNQLAESLVFAIKDPDRTVHVAAFNLLHFVITKDTPQQSRFDFVCSKVEARKNTLIPNNIRKKAYFWEEVEAKVFINSDLEIETGRELTGSLLSTGVLDVLCKIDSPQIVDIVLSMSFHSITACYFIVRSEVLNVIVQRYLEYEKTLKLVSILLKSSLTIAYKVSGVFPCENLVFKNIVSHDTGKVKDGLSLLYSMYCHNHRISEKEALRIALLDIAQSDLSVLTDLYHALSRMIKTLGDSSEFIAFFEIAIYKHLKGVSEYTPALLLFIETYIQYAATLTSSGSSLNVELEEIFRQHVFPIIQNSPVFNIELNFGICRLVLTSYKRNSGIIQILDDFKDYLASIEVYLKEQLLKLTKGKERISYKDLFDNKSLSQLNVCVLKLKSILGLDFNTQLITLGMSTVGFYEEKHVKLMLKYLAKALGMDSVPEYYQGFVSTNRHLQLSNDYFQDTCKVSCRFISHSESQFIPLPLNWLWLPLRSEDFSSYLAMIVKLLPGSIPNNQDLLMTDLNHLLMKTDVLDQRKDLEQIFECVQIQHSSIKMHTSIKNYAQFYIAESYLDPLFTRWLMVYLHDEVPQSVYKPVLEEIQPMLSRIFKVIQSLNIPIDKYSRLLNN